MAINGQQNVFQIQPFAEEGSLASSAYVNPTEVVAGVRAVGIVYSGRWVFRATPPTGFETDRMAESFGSNNGTGLTAADILGICYRNQVAALPADENASLGYNDGQPIPVAKADAFWVRTTTVATVGQSVFAVLADGTTATGAAGATIAGAVEVAGWKVVALQASGAVGDLICIAKG